MCAVANWNNCPEYASPQDVENKIRRIGQANLHPQAQFDNLHKLFQEVNIINHHIIANILLRHTHLLQIYSNDPSGYNFMLGEVLPGIEKLARELQPESISILKAKHEGKVELTKRQIAQILANGFFCNFKDERNLPHINFDKYDFLCAFSVL
jgi:hypothetical protein